MARPKRGTKRPDNLFEYKATLGRGLDGKPQRKSFYSPVSAADARRKADAWLMSRGVSEQVEGAFVARPYTFAEWAEMWLTTYKQGKVKGNTFRGTYAIPTRQQLIPYFGRAEMRSIKPIDIQAFFDTKGKTYALETLKKMRACLHAIFETAVENEVCYRNPVTANLKLTSATPPPEKRVWNREQYSIALAFAQSRSDGLSVWLLLETGMSRSELLGLRRADVDYKNGCLCIRQGLVEMPDAETGHWGIVSSGLKNEHRRRQIPISAALLAVLRALPPGSDWVISSPMGDAYRPSNWQRRVFNPFMDELTSKYPGIPRLSAHELRHTRATLWNNDRVDLFSLARLLGHADLDMLAKRYAHDDLESLKKALEKAE